MPFLKDAKTKANALFLVKIGDIAKAFNSLFWLVVWVKLPAIPVTVNAASQKNKWVSMTDGQYAAE